MSTSTEEYLEALYTLTQSGEPVGTSSISKRLNIAPASVTEMMQKLAESGHVNYSPYQGVTLTPEGFRMAQKITRKHRLLERFLHDVLKINKNKVHQEACKMEHALSDDTARAMCRILKAPDKCPDDGQIIPACDFGFTSCEECRKRRKDDPEKIEQRKNNIVSISILKEGQEGKISFIRGDSKFIRELVDIGLTPGTRITVNQTISPDGSMEIICRGSRVSLDEEITNNVFVDYSHM